MNRKQDVRHTSVAQQRADPGCILMATVDVLPEPYRILGLVEASVTVSTSAVPTDQLLDLLEAEAADLGADGVIGIRIDHIVVPGASRARFVGRITDHTDNRIVATALGTAIRRIAVA